MNPRKDKIAGYLRALNYMQKDGMTQQAACEKAGLSRMTFNKYRELMGDDVLTETTLALPTPKQAKTAPDSSIDRILKENAALQEQINLRRELEKLIH